MTGLETDKGEAADIFAEEAFNSFKQKDLLEKTNNKILIMSLLKFGFLAGAKWGSNHQNNIVLNDC